MDTTSMKIPLPLFCLFVCLFVLNSVFFVFDWGDFALNFIYRFLRAFRLIKHSIARCLL